jgi:hypothetical protein
MKKIILSFWVLITFNFAHAEVSVLGSFFTDNKVTDAAYAAAMRQAQQMNAVPARQPRRIPLASAHLSIDGGEFVLVSAIFMLKSRPDEVCTFDLDNYRSYRCVEGQLHVDGCHLMFFDAQGKWVGLHTMQIKEGFPHFCNAMPAIGVANKTNNELLVTMQYFIPEALQGLPVTPTGGGWFRMTSLFRVKVVNGKIEVEQDDACLGNPNRIDNIPEARKRLRQCGSAK